VKYLAIIFVLMTSQAKAQICEASHLDVILKSLRVDSEDPKLSEKKREKSALAHSLIVNGSNLKCWYGGVILGKDYLLRTSTHEINVVIHYGYYIHLLEIKKLVNQ
jgi:rRNA maturation endonuclease Nob1